MPRGLPAPIPEMAFLLRFILERLGFPASPRRDYIISYLRHVSIVRRIPAKRLLLNDVLFQIKVGPILRSPFATMITDKELVKRHIAKVVGEKYNIPTLAVLHTAEEIDAYKFPDRCIIKPTHASGEYIARKSGERIDLKRIKKWLELDYYQSQFEVNYRGLMPKIIVEPWVFGKIESTELKIFCVNGKAKSIDVIADRFSDYSSASFDINWNKAPYANLYTSARYRKFEKPKHFAEIISVAERLAKDFFFVRIDLYCDDTTIKCGEITNCSAAGLEIYDPRSDELVHSRMLFSDLMPGDCAKLLNKK
jgi:hypothetical protein